MLEFRSKDPEGTISFGTRLGELLGPGDILAISGELGAGKTTLINGIAIGLGVKEFVSSPSFIIVNEYFGRIPLFHMDLYRLEQRAEALEIGVEEYFERGGVVAVEWAERLGDGLPKHISISMEHVSESERKISIEGLGSAREKELKTQ